MARALSSLTFVAVCAAVLFSGVALGAAMKVAPLDQVSSNTLASGDFTLLLSMQRAASESLPSQLAELAGDSRAAVLDVQVEAPQRVRVAGAGHQRRMAMALVGLALRRPTVRERLGVASVELQALTAIDIVAARRSFDAQNGNTTTAAATTTAAPNTTTAAPMMTNSSNHTAMTTTAASTAMPTPPPSTLPASVVAAISATIRIAGTAFAALLNGTPEQRTQLFNAVKADLGTLLGIDAAFVYITNMYLGSLVVEFTVDAAAGVEPTVLTQRLALATNGSAWLASTQSVYSTVSNETLAVTEAPVVTATAPTTTAAPGATSSGSPAAFVATAAAAVAAVAAAVVAL